MRYLVHFIQLLIVNASLAQQAMVTAGGAASGTGGNMSFSVGQPDYGAMGNINSGVQQVYDNGPLPVTWMGIRAIKKEKTVVVQWETVFEYNSSHFIVQRSLTGTDFIVSFDKVLAKGSSTVVNTYAIEDKQPAKGINFYRVVQYDKDGKSSFSAIVSVNFETATVIACYPNPAFDYVMIDLHETDARDIRAQLADINGKIVKTVVAPARFVNIDLNGLPAGTYILRLLKANNIITRFTIIKQ
jgi:hypothetical protein